MLETVVKLDLRVLAVHFDNGWNTPTAEHNMSTMTDALDVPLVRYRVDQEEYNAINRAFLFSGTHDLETPTDLGIIASMYKTCETHGVGYMFVGHSFRTEGIAPLGWHYQDGKYIADVCRKHDGPKEFSTYPNLWLKDFLRWTKIKRIRPLYYVDYVKEEAKRSLHSVYGWRWYDGHHLESLLTDFLICWLLPKRWEIDFRVLGWAALVRSGQMERVEGLERLSTPPVFEDWKLEEVMRRLDISESQLNDILALPKRKAHNFQTYRRAFRYLRPLFWLLYKRGRVPKSFYIKYCQGAG
jgi:hypothetical protein